jgi:hypothetical protein
MPFVEALDRYFWPAIPRWSRIVRKLNKSLKMSQISQ